MGRILEARGPVVEALKRYDPGLRVRWSHEKRKWAVDAPFAEDTDTRMIPKPVRFERIEDGSHWVARLLPEYSERGIQYRDRRYVVCWVKKITPALLGAIVQRDSHKNKKGLVGVFDDDLRAQDEQKRKITRARTDARVYDAYDRFKFDLRHNPNAEDGTGVSVKGYKRLED